MPTATGWRVLCPDLPELHLERSTWLELERDLPAAIEAELDRLGRAPPRRARIVHSDVNLPGYRPQRPPREAELRRVAELVRGILRCGWLPEELANVAVVIAQELRAIEPARPLDRRGLRVVGD